MNFCPVDNTRPSGSRFLYPRHTIGEASLLLRFQYVDELEDAFNVT